MDAKPTIVILTYLSVKLFFKPQPTLMHRNAIFLWCSCVCVCVGGGGGGLDFCFRRVNPVTSQNFI